LLISVSTFIKDVFKVIINACAVILRDINSRYEISVDVFFKYCTDIAERYVAFCNR